MHWSAYSAISVAAAAAAYGSTVGSLIGSAMGAMVAGSIAGMAIVLSTAASVSAVTAARAAAVVGIAVAVGHLGIEAPAVNAPIVNAQEFGAHCIAAAARGVLQFALPALFLGVVLAGRSAGQFWPLCLAALLVAAWWGGGRAFAALPELVQSGIARVTLLPLPNAREPSALVALFAEGIVLVASLIWVVFIRSNRVACRLAFWGAVAGGVAFALAEASRFAGVWVPESVTIGWLKEWPLMPESEPVRAAVSGAAWGALIGWGAWRERAALVSSPDVGSLRLPWEVAFVVMHATILMAARFVPESPSGGMLAAYASSGLVAGALPLACTLLGRRSPWLMLLPLALMPMAGLAIRHVVYESLSLSADLGWLLLAAIPLGTTTAGAAWAMSHDEEHVGARAGVPLGVALGISVVTSFVLAAAMLDFAWPWSKPTPRTPTLTLLAVLAAMLVITAIRIVVVSASAPGASGAGDDS